MNIKRITIGLLLLTLIGLGQQASAYGRHYYESRNIYINHDYRREFVEERQNPYVQLGRTLIETLSRDGSSEVARAERDQEIYAIKMRRAVGYCDAKLIQYVPCGLGVLEVRGTQEDYRYCVDTYLRATQTERF